MSPIAAPARRADFTGLAPAYIDVGDLDIFRDESIAHAGRLASAGARSEHTDQVINALSEALPHSLQHEGGEAIHLRQDQDQDDRTNIMSFTQWATRQKTPL